MDALARLPIPDVQIKRRGLRWQVTLIGSDGVSRPLPGTYWSSITARRIVSRLRAELHIAAWVALPEDDPAPPLADPADAPPDRVQLGAHAKRLLDDPVLALALDRIDRQLAETWRDSAVGASEEREAAYRLHWAVERLRVELRTLLNNAKQIEAEQKRKDEAERRERERRERWVA